MGVEQYNMMLFQTADDAWNAQDVETFANRHTEDVVVYVPAAPTQYGMEAHKEFALNSFKAFPDQRVQNRPYKAFFAGGDWVCSIARYTGTMTGPMIGPDGREIAPTGKSFDVDFCTVGHWKNGQMVEEYLFYDVVTSREPRLRPPIRPKESDRDEELLTVQQPCEISRDLLFPPLRVDELRLDFLEEAHDPLVGGGLRSLGHITPFLLATTG